MNEKRFLVQEHSGRGIAVTLTLAGITERWDLEVSNNPESEFEDTLGEWLEYAEIGDSFTNEEEHSSFTRVD